VATEKNPLAGNPRNSVWVLACGACGWFGALGPPKKGYLQWSLAQTVVVGQGAALQGEAAVQGFFVALWLRLLINHNALGGYSPGLNF